MDIRESIGIILLSVARRLRINVKVNRIAPRRFGIAATLSEGAEIDGALSWVHVDERIKGRYASNDGVARINLHHIVFTAKTSNVEVTLSNADASVGQELGVNDLESLAWRDGFCYNSHSFLKRPHRLSDRTRAFHAW